MGTTVKKHKFNVVDAVIIIVIAAVIGAAVLFFTADTPVVISETVSIEYVVELRTVRDEFVGNFSLNESMVDAVAKYHLGTVIDYDIGPSIYMGNDFSAGAVVIGEYPEHSCVKLTVAAEATVGGDGRYVIDGGYDISVGTAVHLRLPNYTGTAYCTQISETEAK